MSAPAPGRLDHGAAFDLLDKVSQAKVDLQGSLAVALAIIAANADDAVALTVQRHIERDAAALDAAFNAAFDGILLPLRADGGAQ